MSRADDRAMPPTTDRSVTETGADAEAPQPLDGALYVGRVMHRRLGEVRHRFAYRVFCLLVDIDRLPDLDRRLRLFSHDRANLIALRSRDHGARDGSALRPWVEARLAEHGLSAGAARIELLCFPRVLGYVFNPISLYFCRDAEGRLVAMIYEVHNTFGEGHAYVLPVQGSGDGDAPHSHGERQGPAAGRPREGEGLQASGPDPEACNPSPCPSPTGGNAGGDGRSLSPAPDATRRSARSRPVLQECAKRFYVSPFIGMESTYRFRLKEPGERLSFLIRQSVPSGELLIATLDGRRRPLDDRSLAAAFATHPLMTFKVVAAIHWQALKLWLKGATYHPRRPRARGRAAARS
ncbi:MAG: DUF1365 domain-containing protein [Azospirillaceae bacterium]